MGQLFFEGFSSQTEMKFAITLFLLGLMGLSSGLKCRTCSGDGGLCSSVDDNGDSVQCTGDQDACWFMSTRLNDDETIHRSCIDSSSIGEECVDGDVLGAGLTVCFCTEDDCNKDKSCTCNSSSTIGISVMALLVCAY